LEACLITPVTRATPGAAVAFDVSTDIPWCPVLAPQLAAHWASYG
jgi:hypothetical protein